MKTADINPAEVISLYLETLSTTKVAERYGCHSEVIRRILIKNGIARKKRNYIKAPERKNRIYPTDEEVLACYRECCCNQKATAERLDVSSAFVYKRLKNYDVPRGGDRGHCRKITDDEISECTKTMTREEIAERFGIHIVTVDKRMSKLGVHAVVKPHPKPVRKASVDQWKFRQRHYDVVNRLQPGFEYVESTNTYIRMKCLACGTMLERVHTTVRRNRCECEVCKEKKKQAERLAKALEAVIAIRTPKTCVECGSVFFSAVNSAQYCSKACKRKHKGKSACYRERCRKYGVLYDKTVTRKGVIARDGGVCQICGKTCDPTDRRWGTIGPDFPTIDHITALANGGTHTWDNVQCACAICNSTKRDLIDWGCVV